jgi:hypothetical protein
VFEVARHLLESRLWALVATILFFCSAAFLTGTWVVLAGQQELVPLLTCLGVLFCMLQSETAGPQRMLSITGLAAILLIGPWVREALGVVAILVVLEEARRERRPTWIMGLGALGLFHAMFPMLLPKLLIDFALPVFPAPLIGDVGAQLGKPESGGQAFRRLVDLSNLRYGVSGQLAALLPPSFAFLSVVGFAVKSFQELTTAGGTTTIRTGNGSQRRKRWLEKILRQRTLAASTCIAILIAITLVVLWRLPNGPTRAATQFAIVDLLIGAILTLYGWSVSPLLGLWMALTLLPFYWVFTEIVHLAYPMVPAAIIAAAGLRECWLGIRRLNSPLARPLRYAFAAGITILLLDQMLNLYAVWHVVQESNRGMRDVAAALRRDVPRGSVIIGNVIHLYSIDRYSHNWFRPYFTVRAGTLGPYADSPAEVTALLAQYPATTYLLDADQPYLPGQYLYHSHPLVRSHAVDWADLGTLHKTRAVYPLLDPLQAVIPGRFVPFPGAPDLVQDFYHGRALSGAPFLREVYVDYHLYRVSGTMVRPW